MIKLKFDNKYFTPDSDSSNYNNALISINKTFIWKKYNLPFKNNKTKSPFIDTMY